MATTHVGPSMQRVRWQEFFSASAWQPAAFDALVRSEPVGAALFEVESQIDGLYRAALLAKTFADRFDFALDRDRWSQARLKAQWLSASFESVRERLGAGQRELDLALLRWMRRSSCLSVFVGAGVSMDAGAPSWAELVQRILLLARERGKECSELRATATSTPDQQTYRRVVTHVERLGRAADARAQELLTQIAIGTADSAALMDGAQLCYDFFGQHLFTDVTQILYERNRQPGAVHRAIAELAKPIQVHDRGGWFPGWHAIVSYNFDDLIGEALDDIAVPRAAYAMRADEILGDPNSSARDAGPAGVHQPIYHLHGYSPRKLFRITGIRYVFSTEQFADTYRDIPSAIVGRAFTECLANPVLHSLYVGCSFQDESMNTLLRNAFDALPGRYHYALLKWSGSRRYQASSADEIAIKSAQYVSMGVRPIWFDEFSELPGLIRSLE
jgi:hypothetical protein